MMFFNNSLDVETGKWYLAYLPTYDYRTRLHYCHAQESPYDSKYNLYAVDSKRFYNFKDHSEWELFELTHDEILTHIVLEYI